MSLPRIPLTPLWAEIGRDGDWNSAALVEEIGASNDGETKIMQTLDRGRFELWHKSGLKMRIPLEAMLDEACEALRLEAADEVLRREAIEALQLEAQEREGAKT